jgi:hypothetical protein
MTGRRNAKLAAFSIATRIMAAASLLETKGDRRVSDRRAAGRTWHIQPFYCFGCMRLLPAHDFPLIDGWRYHGPTP